MTIPFLPYLKAYASLVGAIVTALLGVFTADTTVGQILTVVAVIATVIATWAAPNLDPNAEHQDESVQPAEYNPENEDEGLDSGEYHRVSDDAEGIRVEDDIDLIQATQAFHGGNGGSTAPAETDTPMWDPSLNRNQPYKGQHEA